MTDSPLCGNDDDTVVEHWPGEPVLDRPAGRWSSMLEQYCHGVLVRRESGIFGAWYKKNGGPPVRSQVEIYNYLKSQLEGSPLKGSAQEGPEQQA